MNIIDLNNLQRYKDFIIIEGDKVNIVFSTAERGRSFNRNTDEGRENLDSLKKDFMAKEVVYLNQIHSDKVFVYEGNELEFIKNEGDALITDKEKVIIGAFTADCVPVILVDETKGVIAAIHSGWKGTFNSITKKTIEKMVSEFGSDSQDIKAYIGPHIRECCYEVSEELKDKFLEKTKIAENKLFKGRNLNMEVCIEQDLIESGVKEDNIYSLNLCTYCENKISLHSYRKSEGTYGRLFTFVYKK